MRDAHHARNGDLARPRTHALQIRHSTGALGLTLAFALVLLTRWPVARAWPMDSDEFGFVEQIRAHWFPMHHTLFLALGAPRPDVRGCLSRVHRAGHHHECPRPGLGLVVAAGACPPADSRGGCGRAGVRAGVLGLWRDGRELHGDRGRGIVPARRGVPDTKRPGCLASLAAAVVLAFGTGYRQDIGTFWLPVFVVILWQHRWKRAFLAGAVFTVLNLAWLLPMLHDVGGWTRYRAASASSLTTRVI